MPYCDVDAEMDKAWKQTLKKLFHSKKYPKNAGQTTRAIKPRRYAFKDGNYVLLPDKPKRRPVNPKWITTDTPKLKMGMLEHAMKVIEKDHNMPKCKKKKKR